jgi:hypothetical protein
LSLKDTSLIVQAAPLPVTFEGTPNDFLAAMVQRMRVVSPNGANFIFIGDVAPTTNVGPWLKGGTQWYVWDNTTNSYVPLDVSASITIPYWIGNATPTGNSPPVWLQTTNNSTDQNPNGFGTPISWYFWNGTGWQTFNSVPQSGSTAGRPGSPVNFQQYFDTDINVLLHWERAAWRTVSGSPGDTKFVTSITAASALLQNPGWLIFSDSITAYRGRALSQATQDAGGSPAYSQSVPAQPSGTQARAVGDTWGTGPLELLQLNGTSQTSLPGMLALYLLVKQ